MPFSIKRYPVKWAEFKCPECGVQRLEKPEDPRQVWYWEETNYRGGIPMIVSTFTSIVSCVVQTFASTVYGAKR